MRLFQTDDMVPMYKRTQKGTKGKAIALRANLFKLDFKDEHWYKYDVEISTSTEEKVS